MSAERSKLTEADSPAQEKENPRGKRDALVKWRREKVWELKACGLTYDEIVEALRPKPGIKISHGTVARDLEAKQREIKEGFKHYIEDELPLQHRLVITGLERVIKEAWRMYARDENRAKEMLPIVVSAYGEKLKALGDPSYIDKALKTVARIKEQVEANS